VPIFFFESVRNPRNARKREGGRERERERWGGEKEKREAHNSHGRFEKTRVYEKGRRSYYFAVPHLPPT